jgi:hypothetical protein
MKQACIFCDCDVLPKLRFHQLQAYFMQPTDYNDKRLMTLLCKKITAMKSKEMKTRCNLAESFKAMAQIGLF